MYIVTFEISNGFEFVRNPEQKRIYKSLNGAKRYIKGHYPKCWETEPWYPEVARFEGYDNEGTLIIDIKEVKAA